MRQRKTTPHGALCVALPARRGLAAQAAGTCDRVVAGLRGERRACRNICASVRASNASACGPSCFARERRVRATASGQCVSSFSRSCLCNPSRPATGAQHVAPSAAGSPQGSRRGQSNKERTGREAALGNEEVRTRSRSAAAGFGSIAPPLSPVGCSTRGDSHPRADGGCPEPGCASESRRALPPPRPASGAPDAARMRGGSGEYGGVGSGGD